MSLITAKRLEEEGVVLQGHFLLNSGMHSSRYVNKDAMFSNPELFKDVSNGLLELLACDINEFDAITGPAIAGAILAAPLALMLHKIFVYPEKTEDGRGMVFRRGYDKVLKGKRLAIIEDIMTTGNSVQRTMTSAESCGATITRVITIWNRFNIRFDNIRVFSLINKEIESYTESFCLLCKSGVPLTNPKTGVIINNGSND